MCNFITNSLLSKKKIKNKDKNKMNIKKTIKKKEIKNKKMIKNIFFRQIGS